MAESIKTRLMRWGFNFFPAYRRTGARFTYIADDLHEIRIRLPLNWKTRNYVGTIFGGSMYSAVDPVYMVMLIKLLGPDYIVWDKAATIHFRKPGRTTLYARFTLDQRELEVIREQLQHEPKIERIFRADLTDRQGTVHATVDKTLHIRRNAGARR